MTSLLTVVFLCLLPHSFLQNARSQVGASFGPAFGAAQVIPASINVEEYVYDRSTASSGYLYRLIRKKSPTAKLTLPSFRATAVLALLFLVLICTRAQFGRKLRHHDYRNLAVGGSGVCSSQEAEFSDATVQNTIMMLERDIRSLLLTPPVVSEQLHLRLTVLENGYLALLGALKRPLNESPFVNTIAVHSLSYLIKTHGNMIKWLTLHCEAEELGNEVHIKTVSLLQKQCEEAVRSLVLNFPAPGIFHSTQGHAALLNTQEQCQGYALHLGKLQQAAFALLNGNLPFSALRDAEALLSTSGDSVSVRAVRAGILEFLQEVHSLVLKYEAGGLIVAAVREAMKAFIQEMVVLASVECLRSDPLLKVAYEAVSIIRMDLRVLVSQLPVGESATSIREIHTILTQMLRLLETGQPAVKVSESTLRSVRRHFVYAVSSVCYLLCSVSNAVHDSRMASEARVEPSACVQALINSISHATYLRSQFLEAVCLALREEAERLRTDASLLPQLASMTITGKGVGKQDPGSSAEGPGSSQLQPFGTRLATMIQLQEQLGTGQPLAEAEQWKRRAFLTGEEVSRQSSVIMTDHERILKESVKCAASNEEGEKLANELMQHKLILGHTVAEAVLNRMRFVGEVLTESIHRSLGSEKDRRHAIAHLPTDPEGERRAEEDKAFWAARDEMFNSGSLVRPRQQPPVKHDKLLGRVSLRPGDVRLPVVVRSINADALADGFSVPLPSNVAAAFTALSIQPFSAFLPRVFFGWPGSNGEAPSAFSGTFTSESSILVEEHRRMWPRRPPFGVYGSVPVQLHPDLVASLISGIVMRIQVPAPTLPSGSIVDPAAYPYTTPILMYNINPED